MNIDIDLELESKDLIYAACISAVNGIIERRKRRNFADDLDSIVSINLGRQTGHTDATIKLYDHYTRKGYSVFIVSTTREHAKTIRDRGRGENVNISNVDCTSIRTFLNPITWRGRSLDKTIFILDTTMRGFTDSVLQFLEVNRLSVGMGNVEDQPIFIGLGIN